MRVCSFPDRIENTFQLKKLRVNPALETLVYPIFSNLIGGIGFVPRCLAASLPRCLPTCSCISY